MLFNSVPFIFYFLPLVVAGFYLFERLQNHRVELIWLVAASMFFYAFWSFPYIFLLLASIGMNYGFGLWLGKNPLKPILFAGIALNLAFIGAFKYAGFFAKTAEFLGTGNVPLPEIALPLAISFFTFQQIAYLVDVYQGEVSDRNFLRYILFVSFFPQLIAGPIVHHREVIPQFVRRRNERDRFSDLITGLAIFLIGLQKKIILADGISVYADAVFAGASESPPSFITAWVGTFAYAFQLYFDFSGYSDMAIGLARMFGVRLPENFASPYKAANIVEFWQRWHMTLSRFLRDYVYIPLGGNRRGEPRRFVNIMITMLLGGLWHGAGWTFVFWGGLHGAMIVLYYAWKNITRGYFHSANQSNGMHRVIGIALTFILVSIGWIFFRAESWDDAIAILSGIAGLNGFSLSHSMAAMVEQWTGLTLSAQYISESGTSIPAVAVQWILGLGILIFVAPNTRQIIDWVTGGYAEANSLRLALSAPMFCVFGIIGSLIIISNGSAASDFIYMIF